LLLVVVVAAGLIASGIWRRRSSLISTRGFGVRADVERLHDLPQVRVSEVTVTDPNVARLVLADANVSDADSSDSSPVELVFSVELDEADRRFDLLHEWLERQSVLGIVLSSENQILRLRCLEDLRPLTLRRLDT
jgi:hypothetical protein